MALSAAPDHRLLSVNYLPFTGLILPLSTALYHMLLYILNHESGITSEKFRNAFLNLVCRNSSSMTLDLYKSIIFGTFSESVLL